MENCNYFARNMQIIRNNIQYNTQNHEWELRPHHLVAYLTQEGVR